MNTGQTSPGQMNSDQLRDASLLELFQMEAVSQAEVLNGGLLALERDPTSAVHLEACMRAAHSLKGAARIVDLEPGVRIAHVMEDVLVDAQAGRLLLESRHIDVLLQGVDLLLQVGDPLRHMTISTEQVDVGALPSQQHLDVRCDVPQMVQGGGEEAYPLG